MTLQILFHFANALALLAFLFRDQFHLRVVVAISMALQALYYFIVPGGPLFDPLIWKVMTVIANVAMIAILFHDRFGHRIDAELQPLFDALRILSPGQFRRLVAISTQLSGPAPLTVRGEVPAALYYVLSGEAEVVKDGRVPAIRQGVFLGEIAYLTDGYASADVNLKSGGSVIAWKHDALRRLTARDKTIDIALRSLLTQDLAIKTARSDMPAAPPVELIGPRYAPDISFIVGFRI